MSKLDNIPKEQWDEAAAAVMHEDVSKLTESLIAKADAMNAIYDERNACVDDHGPEFGDGPEFEGWEQRTSNPSNPKQLYGDKKVPIHLVPPTAIAYLALALRDGARKYGAYNYRETKVESMTYIGAAMRHIMAYLDGEWLDDDSGNPHIAHAMACLAILADCTEGANLIDNRPAPGPAPTVLKAYSL